MVLWIWIPYSTCKLIMIWLRFYLKLIKECMHLRQTKEFPVPQQSKKANLTTFDFAEKLSQHALLLLLI